MKLQELAASKPTKNVARVFESYFGSRMSFDQLTGPQAWTMLKRVRNALSETRQQRAFHKSEKNPAYLKMVMLEQALSARIMEIAPVPPVAAAAPGATPQTAVAGGQPAVAGAVAKDPKLASALKKTTAGQTLTPEEQKLVAGAAMMQAESRLRRAYRTLKESEVQQAQVVLAAQDMVDKMQKMIEDTSSLQFKELPALVDSIKNQVGMEQAQQFNADASAALTGLVQNLQGSKQQMEQALGVVTGQQAVPAANLASPAANDMNAVTDIAPGDEMGVDMDPTADEEIPPPQAALGRARR